MSAKVVMVTSGKGGTGKSTFSVLLGAALVQKGKNVLLIELDAGLRSVDIIAGVGGQTVFDLNDVLLGKCNAGKAVLTSPVYKGLRILSAPYQAQKINRQLFASFIGALRGVVDYIVIDTAAGLGSCFQTGCSVLNQNDLALLVLTPDLVAVRDGATAANALPWDKGIKAGIVFNKVGAQIGPGLEHLDQAMDMVGAPLMGVIPYSDEVLAAADGAGLAKGLAQTCIDNIATRMIGTYVPLAVR